ncbi:MAG: AAA family ATPase, partial [Defluviitaleaceae bacterium]|nr:AAA family ATPase [Defluviitaleaceae bacterium]
MNITRQELSPNVNIIHGNNAQGKTNFLEAVYFCAFGRSLRARTDGELIKWNEKNAHLRLETERAGITSTLDARLENMGKKTAKS